MKLLHMADVHLGCVPDGRSEWAQMRGRELWETFRESIADADREKADLVLIAGDLFHAPPSEAQLREVNYLLGSYPEICFALIAGNHDYAGSGSAWESFSFAPNVAFLGGAGPECIRFNALGCEVYGFSYDRPRIREALYDRMRPEGNDLFHILLAHGGDAQHIPFTPASLQALGFDYIALGHIHKPSVVIPDKALYSGALSPIDAGDEGPHGYLLGECVGKTAVMRFVPKAPREYVSMTILCEAEDTLFSLRDKVEAAIDRRGREHIYRITLSGQRNPAMRPDPELFLKCGMVLEAEDRTVPAFQTELLKERCRGQLIGRYIESFEGHERSLIEEKALQYGLEALLGSGE